MDGILGGRIAAAFVTPLAPLVLILATRLTSVAQCSQIRSTLGQVWLIVPRRSGERG